MNRLVVLTPPAPRDGQQWRPPGDLPLGRAARTLADERLAEVLFVSQVPTGRGPLAGLSAVDDGHWRETTWAADSVEGVYDRFPSQRDPETWRQLRERLGAALWVNAPAATLLCRDKLASQRALVAQGVPMPEVVEVDGRHRQPQHRWGGGYLKPRYGAFGAGVQRVDGLAPLPMRLAGLVADRDEPALLQRAIAPPALRLPDGRQARAASVRALAQRVAERDGHSAWVTTPLVARVSLDRDVVNVAGGALVCPLDTLVTASGGDPAAVARTRRLAVRTARALVAHIEAAAPGDGQVVEVGVDVVFDATWSPWVVEVNGKPAGKLATLVGQDPARFAVAQREANLRPLRWLCAAITARRDR